MKIRNLMAAAAAITLATAPVVAQAAGADMSRVAAPVSDESEMGGDSSLLYILGAILLGVGIYLIVDDNSPSSP
jgi:hypothetical protein